MILSVGVLTDEVTDPPGGVSALLGSYIPVIAEDLIGILGMADVMAGVAIGKTIISDGMISSVGVDNSFTVLSAFLARL